MTALPAAMSLRNTGEVTARSFLQKSISDRGDTSAWTDSPAERKRKAIERGLADGTLNGNAASAALGLGSAAVPKRRPPSAAAAAPPPVPTAPKQKSLMEEHLARMKSDATATAGAPKAVEGWNYERDMKARRVNPKANKEFIDKAQDLMANFTTG